MLKLGQTAEDFLTALLTDVDDRLALVEALYTPALHDSLPEKQQILMTGYTDEARELKRLAEALDAAQGELSVRPKPRRDEDRG